MSSTSRSARSFVRSSERGRGLRQIGLPFPASNNGWGGRRRGAGRKRRGNRGNVRHEARPQHAQAHPVHVVMRAKYRSLRTQFVFPTLRQALADAARARADFRVVQFSVQGNHLHLIVEASGKVALSRGMQGLAIRVARRVNRLVSRRGKLWDARFFARDLTSPRAVRHALAYVLNNFRKHRARGAARIDPYSSAPYFNGFRGLRGSAPCELSRGSELALIPRGVSPPGRARDVPVVNARTWLGASGWRRAGLIDF
jgi:REP element-mobilizing transposase RayT